MLNASDPLFNVSLAFDFWPGYVWRDGLYDTQEQCDAGRCSTPHRSNNRLQAQLLLVLAQAVVAVVAVVAAC